MVEELFPPGLVPMLEQQLRRSLCCDEGPDNEETVTDVELAPAVEAEAEDGNACNNNIHSKTTLRLVLFLIKYKKINLLNQMYIFQFHHSMSGSSALHPLTFNGSGRRPRRLQARPPRTLPPFRQR